MHGFLRLPAAGLVLLAAGTLSGCASYYLHYGGFAAENSNGQTRQFHVTWKTAHYPAWWFSSDKATPVVVTAQCSKREWRLQPADKSGCGKGITACGVPGLDLNQAGEPVKGNKTVCMSVTDAQDTQSISRLSGEIELSVHCYPTVTEIKQDGKTVNVDYLKASAVPYSVPTRKVPLYSLGAGPVPFDTHICKTN